MTMLTLLGLLPLNRVRIQLSKQYMTAARHMTHTRLAPVSFMCTCLNLSHDHLLPSWNHADSAMLTGAKRQPNWPFVNLKVPCLSGCGDTTSDRCVSLSQNLRLLSANTPEHSLQQVIFSLRMSYDSPGSLRRNAKI